MGFPRRTPSPANKENAVRTAPRSIQRPWDNIKAVTVVKDPLSLSSSSSSAAAGTAPLPSSPTSTLPSPPSFSSSPKLPKLPNERFTPLLRAGYGAEGDGDDLADLALEPLDINIPSPSHRHSVRNVDAFDATRPANQAFDHLSPSSARARARSDLHRRRPSPPVSSDYIHFPASAPYQSLASLSRKPKPQPKSQPKPASSSRTFSDLVLPPSPPDIAADADDDIDAYPRFQTRLKSVNRVSWHQSVRGAESRCSVRATAPAGCMYSSSEDSDDGADIADDSVYDSMTDFGNDARDDLLRFGRGSLRARDSIAVRGSVGLPKVSTLNPVVPSSAASEMQLSSLMASSPTGPSPDASPLPSVVGDDESDDNILLVNVFQRKADSTPPPPECPLPPPTLDAASHQSRARSRYLAGGIRDESVRSSVQFDEIDSSRSPEGRRYRGSIVRDSARNAVPEPVAEGGSEGEGEGEVASVGRDRADVSLGDFLDFERDRRMKTLSVQKREVVGGQLQVLAAESVAGGDQSEVSPSTMGSGRMPSTGLSLAPASLRAASPRRGDRPTTGDSEKPLYPSLDRSSPKEKMRKRQLPDRAGGGDDEEEGEVFDASERVMGTPGLEPALSDLKRASVQAGNELAMTAFTLHTPPRNGGEPMPDKVSRVNGQLLLKTRVLRRWITRFVSIVDHQYFGAVMFLFCHDATKDERAKTGAVTLRNSKMIVLADTNVREVSTTLRRSPKSALFELRTTQRKYLFAAENCSKREFWISQIASCPS